MTNDGKWNQMIRDHNKSILKQISSRINALKLLANGDSSTRLMVATAIIQSKLQYLMPLWGGAPDYLLKVLQVQQLRAARLVWGNSSYYWSTEKLLRKCGWLSIKQQVFYSTTMLAHNIISTKTPYHIYTGLVSRYHYNTRTVTNTDVRYHSRDAYDGHTQLTLNSFKYRAQRYWFTYTDHVTI